MRIQQLFPVEGSHITWRVLPIPSAIKKEPNHCLKKRLKTRCQKHSILAWKPEQVLSRWRLGYTISPCMCVCENASCQLCLSTCALAKGPVHNQKKNSLQSKQNGRESAVASALGGTGHGSSSLPTLTSILSSLQELSSVIPGH